MHVSDAVMFEAAYIIYLCVLLCTEVFKDVVAWQLEEREKLVEMVVLEDGGGVETSQGSLGSGQEGIVEPTVVKIMAQGSDEHRHPLQMQIKVV